MSSFSPFWVWKKGTSSSWKPYLYSPRAVAWASSGVSSVLANGNRLLVDAKRGIAVALELVGKLGAARAGDAAVHQHVDDVGLDVVEQARVMRDHEDAHVRAGELVHALRDDAQRVDVEAGVGLVHDRELRPQDGHLEDLDPLLLAAREAVVQVARRHRAVDLQHLHVLLEELPELGDADRVLAAVLGAPVRVHRHPQEVRDGDARDRARIL